jgi:GDPmannose 4,6-dehydratase
LLRSSKKRSYWEYLDSICGWEYAPEYDEDIWRVLQYDTPDDYVLATNTVYSVREFLKFASDTVNLDWEEFVKFDQRYERPTEVDALIDDYSKAKNS